MLSDSIAYYREIGLEKKDSINVANLTVILRNCHSHFNLQQPLPYQLAAINIKILHQQND